MKRELFIISPPGGGDLFHWCLREGDSTRCGRSGAADIAGIAHDRLVCLIAAEDVFIGLEDRPPGREAQVRKALPFVIEERLAAPVESVHVAFAGAPDGRLLVAAVARDRLDALISRLREAGLVPDLVAPDCLALPWRPGRLSLLLTEDRFLARLPDGAGAGMEREALSAWLALAGSDGEETVVYRCGGDTGAVPASARVVEGPEDWPSLLAAGGDPAPDFLCGEYGNSGRIRALPPFVLATAVLLFVLSGLFCLSRVLDHLRLGRMEARLSAAVTGVYRKAFPGESVIDPRAQMEKKLAAVSRQGDGFLPLLAEAAPVLLEAGGFRLQRLRYDGRRIVLEVDLASIAEFDRVRAALAARLRRTVKTGQIRKRKDGVRGELRIETREAGK